MPKTSNTRCGWLGAALKVGLAAAVIFWLVRSGRLDLGLVGRARSQWPILIAIGAMFYVQAAMLAWRWRRLSAALGLAMTGKQAFSLTMIGLLFNTAIPGAVSGDLMKGYYAARGRGDTAGHVASILVDRIAGLFSLVAMAVCGAAWNARALAGNSALSAVWQVMAGMLVAAVVLFVGVILASRSVADKLNSFAIPLPFRGAIAGFLEALAAYRRKPLSVAGAFARSVPCHLLACGAFYLAARAISSTPVPPSLVMFIVPLGLASTALPLTPAGVGVGQAAFYALFEYAAKGQGSIGSSAFTLYQIVFLLVSLSGAFFYLKQPQAAPRPVASTACTGGQNEAAPSDVIFDGSAIEGRS